MSTGIAAVEVDSIIQVATTADGQSALINCKSGDEQLILAFPYEKLGSLMEAISHAFGECSRTQKREHAWKDLLPVHRLDVRHSSVGDMFALSFCMTGGMVMTFPVTRSSATNIRDALSRALGSPPPSDDG